MLSEIFTIFRKSLYQKCVQRGMTTKPCVVRNERLFCATFYVNNHIKASKTETIDNILAKKYTAVAQEVAAVTLPFMLTVSEAAQVLRVSSKTMYRIIRTREINCVQVRGQYRISSQAIAEYIERGGRSSEG